MTAMDSRPGEGKILEFGRYRVIPGRREVHALRNVETGIQEGLLLGHGLSLGNVLAQAACPVALLAGKLDVAERYITMFTEQAAANMLDVWRIYGRCFRGMLRIREGDVSGGLAQLGEAVDELRRASPDVTSAAALLRSLQ
jgi:hypothetical protein